MLSFKDATLTPFVHLPGDSLLGALTKTGVNAMTPDKTLAYTKSVQGLGTEVGSLLSSLGGRTPNLSTMNELQDMASQGAGMSPLVGMYGTANVIDIARTYLRNLPLADTNPKIQSMLKQLEKFPKPDEVAKLINEQADKKTKKQLAKLRSAGESDRQEAIKRASTPPTGEGALPPEGFTMTPAK
jgi:hypothetical protein